MKVDSTLLVPMVFSDLEVSQVVDTAIKCKNDVCQEYNQNAAELPIGFGAMLSTPRACLRANKIAAVNNISLVCFDTDMLTQLMLGISADDSHMFLVSNLISN